jgi:hypothetical protein
MGWLNKLGNVLKDVAKQTRVGSTLARRIPIIGQGVGDWVESKGYKKGGRVKPRGMRKGGPVGRPKKVGRPRKAKK